MSVERPFAIHSVWRATRTVLQDEDCFSPYSYPACLYRYVPGNETRKDSRVFLFSKILLDARKQGVLAYCLNA
jgi:hypothetical protein